MRNHTGNHTCAVWSKGTGDGDWRRLSLTKPHCRTASGKTVRQPSEPEPKPTPSLATTHTKQNASKQANRWDQG
jgi:hypothetical protein